MEIIKLGSISPDESLLTKKHKRDIVKEDAISLADSFRVTDIKQAVKNENRVNIFVNNEYSFSLDIAQLVDFKLKIGSEFNGSELEKYKKASAFGKLYQRTLEWALVRPRSVKEVHDYLWKKQCDKEDEKNIIDKLIQKQYLDDYKFAKFYVENRFVKKGISTKRLSLELAKKGISKTIIEDVLADSARNDLEEIKKIISKKRNRYDDEKLTSYLARQGFSYDLIREALETED